MAWPGRSFPSSVSHARSLSDGLPAVASKPLPHPGGHGVAGQRGARRGWNRWRPGAHVMGRKVLYSMRGERRWDCTRLTALPESRMARNGLPLIFTSNSGAPAGRSRCTMHPASQVRAGAVGASVGMGSSCGEGGPGLLSGRWVPSGVRRSWTTLRGNGGARSPASRCWAASASSIASTSSEVVVGLLIPTACRWERGRAQRKGSTTTRSATWLADGDPSSSQCCARRMSSAAWARAGRRGLYSHSWKYCAAQMGDRPRRAKISFLTSTYWLAEAAGRAK